MRITSAVCAIGISVTCGAATATAQTVKFAYYNIQAGKGEPALPGHPVTFTDNQNCTDPSQPLNAWGIGLVQTHLVDSIGKDPAVVALALGESWAGLCGSPENVRKALGWKARSSERNGVALVARHGFAGPEEWVQLDTSLNPNPGDTMWVLRLAVCLNAACSETMNVFSAHWYSNATDPTIAATSYDRQAEQTVAFLKRAGGSAPHVLVADLNVWEGVAACGQSPIPTGLSRLRAAGYVDAWPAVNGSLEGFTGMLNRPKCGTPEGYAWKRIDYAWAPANYRPISMTRFGMVPPGDGAPSDHYGVIAEYPWPGGPVSEDTVPPVVTLLTPTEGQTISAPVTISVSAADDVGVARVEILIDGVVANTLTAAPYQVTSDLTTKGDGAHTVAARAFDAAGNVSVTPNTTVFVQTSTQPPPETSGSEIVLYAKTAAVVSGGWRVVTDTQAAGGARISHPDAGAPKLAAPLSVPINYFEMTFTAEAGRSYRLWLRGRADRDYWGNDSVFVQFSGSVDAMGTPIYRIGTTGATSVNLEDASNAGLAGWGWQDNGYPSILGPLLRFAASGPQTIRIQTREDGLSIDQIVLSSERYLTSGPGSLKLDATILSQTSPTPPPPPPPPGEEVLLRAASAVTIAGRWKLLADATAAGGTAVGHPDAGGGFKLAAPLAAPVNYVEFRFDAEAGRPYRLWLRGRADRDYWGNDSVFVQFSASVDGAGKPSIRIGTTDAASVNLEDASGAGLSGWGWQDNGYPSVLGPLIQFAATGTQTIRIQTREDGLRIDQIVLSPQKYLTMSPGALKNDTTILP